MIWPFNNKKEEEKKEENQEQKNQQGSTSQGAYYPDLATVKKVAQRSSEDEIKKNAPHIFNAMGSAGLVSKNQLVGVVATIEVECNFRCIEEIGRGGGRYGKYWGRGFIQLTWQSNYAAAGKALNLPLVEKPELALQPDIAAKIFIWYWKSRGVAEAAERGDWRGVRKKVNGGYHGYDVFISTVERGLEYFTSGVKGNFPLDSSYGLGCLDGQGGLGLNDSNLGNAVLHALGVFNLLNAHSHQIKLSLNPSGYVDLLRLEPQAKFQLKNFSDDLDGEYWVDEVIFYGPSSAKTKQGKTAESLEIELVGFRPNPNAMNPSVITSGGSLNNPGLGPVPQGEIPNRIYQAAISNKGKTTADGPPVIQGGRLGCAYAVNKYAIIPAGLKPLGTGSEWGSLSVSGILDALNSGRGKKIPLKEVVPGDIWIDHKGTQHVGIFTEKEGKRVLSNSSSKASFSWECSIEEISKYYGGTGDNFYRVIN